MARFLIQEILSVSAGRLIGNYDEDIGQKSLSGISTDSRAITEGSLFLALIGQTYDGHQFCQDAYNAGARYFLVSEATFLPDNAVGILVDDTLRALQAIAQYYRKRMNCTVLAVTGSVGKTSTRQMLETAFSGLLKTHVTKGNNNNEIGLPLTILSAPEDTELLILEMGMRLKGEIRELTKIAKPDIAVVTNIGVSHIERLGSQKEILEAKMEICEGLGAQGLLVINGDDYLLRNFVNQPSNRTWRDLGITSFSTCKDFDDQASYIVHAEKVELYSDRTDFSVCVHADNDISKYNCRLGVVGAHHVRNALVAILCAAGLRQDINQVLAALENYVPVGSRGRIIHTKHFTIYDDAYNASPESMAAAFDSIKQIARGRRITAVLGGILELGEYAPQIHEQLGEKAGEFGFETIYICGENKEDFKNGIRSVSSQTKILLFEDKDILLAELLSNLRPDDVILIKASNSFGFEDITEQIIQYDHDIQSKEG